MKKEDLRAELSNEGTLAFNAFDIWYFFIKFVVPVAIAFVAVAGIISMADKLALMLLGLAIIVITAIFSRKL